LLRSRNARRPISLRKNNRLPCHKVSSHNYPRQSRSLLSRPQQIGHLLQSERANAFLWEYRYLNLFLARSTQLVLDWLGTLQQPISVNLLDSHLQAYIVDAQERVAILTALQNHHLILIQNNLVQITPKGREYLQWRGPLPAAPTA